MRHEEIGLMLLAAAEVPNFLAGLLPSLFTIRTFRRDPDTLDALRRGELIGSALALTVGAGASLVARSPWPLVACGAVLAVLLYEYERAIRAPLPNARDMRSGAGARGPLYT